MPVSPSRRASALGTLGLIACAALVACGSSPDVGGTGGAGTVGSGNPVVVPDSFPADLVPLLDGTVTNVSYEAVNNSWPTQKWSVSLVPNSGGASEAVSLLENAGWDLDEGNHQLADGSDNWLFSGEYSLSVIESAGPPAGLYYVLRLDGASEIALPADFPADDLPLPEASLSEFNYAANATQKTWVFTLTPATGDLDAAVALATGAGWTVGGNTGYEHSFIAGDYTLGLGTRNFGETGAGSPIFYYLTLLVG